MVDSELTGMGVDQPAPAASPAPAPPLPPPLPHADEAEALDIAVAVKKKRRPYRHKKFGCTVAEQIMKAVAATKRRRGLSVATMKKMLSASGCKLGRNDSRLNRAVRSLVTKGSLVQTAGATAGSVRLSKKLEKEAATGKEAFRRTLVVKRLAKKSKPPSAGRKNRKPLKKTGRRNRNPATVFRKADKWRAARMRRAARRPIAATATKTPSASDKSKDLAVQKTGSFQSH